MPKTKLDCFYYITQFSHHYQIKYKLLELISNSQSVPCVDEGCETNIARTDWCYSDNFQRKWVEYLNEFLLKELLEIYRDCGYDGFTLHEIWFQQYYKNSSHGWHTHSSNFTSVYYVDLPEGSPKTQIVHPFDQKTIIEAEVKEGDILLFPSFVLHKAPINQVDKNKTIVSFNTNVTYSNDIYGQGLENALF